MDNSDVKWVRVEGERLERLQRLAVQYDETTFERKKLTVLANEVRWFISKKFESVEDLNTTYKAMNKRHVTFLTNYRKKLLLGIQKSQAILENSST